jgi:hypothetical protein
MEKKYDPLGDFLQSSENTTEILTFQEIEEILGSTLPKTANKPAFWTNGVTAPLVHQKAWIDAGWKVKNPTEASRTGKVTFYRPSPPRISLRQILAYFDCPYMPRDESRLKNAYEKMIQQYDPSKLKNLEMAQELIELAEKRTKEINDMYEKAESYFI